MKIGGVVQVWEMGIISPFYHIEVWKVLESLVVKKTCSTLFKDRVPQLCFDYRVNSLQHI